MAARQTHVSGAPIAPAFETLTTKCLKSGFGVAKALLRCSRGGCAGDDEEYHLHRSSSSSLTNESMRDVACCYYDTARNST